MEKTSFSTVLCTVACVLSAACTQPSAEDRSPREMTDRQLLEFLGYDTRSMIERDAYLLLVPDIVVSKEELAEWRNKPQTRMQRGYGLLSEDYQTIYLNASGIEEHADLLARAVEEWNNVPESNLEFILDNSAASAVVFRGYQAGDAFDPVSIQKPAHAGRYGKFVELNYSKVKPLLSEPTRGKYFMMHILGHLVGFGHAVTDEYAMPGDNYIIGTAVSDKKSIMRAENDILYGHNGEKWTGFSESDILTIQYLYPPKEKPRFTLDCEPAGVGTDGSTLALGTTYTFTAKYVYSSSPDPRYEITVMKNTSPIPTRYEFDQTGNGRFTIDFTEAGTYTVSVKATNAIRSNLIERTYRVFAPDPFLSAPKEIRLGEACKFSVRIDYPNSTVPPYTVSVTPPASENDYHLSQQKSDGFSIRFHTQGAYKIVVKRNPAGNTQSASCDLYLHFRPYMKAEKIAQQQDGRTRYEHRAFFYADEALSTPEELYEGFEFTCELYYRGIFRQGVEIEKNVGPVSSKKITLDASLLNFYRENGYIELPDCEESVETTGKPGGMILGKSYMKYPYYTLTIPENSCVVHNPVY